MSIRKKHQRGERKEEKNGVRVAALIIAFSWSCKQRYHSISCRQRRPCYKEASVGIVESRTARFSVHLLNNYYSLLSKNKKMRAHIYEACLL